MIAIAHLLLAFLTTTVPVGGSDELLVLRDVRIPTSDLAEFTANAFVVVEGERIVAVGVGEPPSEYAAATVVEGRCAIICF